MPPRAAAESVLVVAEAGLGNKLRVALSYLDVARRCGQQLVVFWRLGPACDTRFLSLFEPLHGVHFIHQLDEIEAVRLVQQPSPCHDSHPAIKYTPREAEMYLALRPLPAIARDVAELTAACGGTGGETAHASEAEGGRGSSTPKFSSSGLKKSRTSRPPALISNLG